MLTHASVPPSTPTRVLLLGANGFLARHLRARLAAEGIPCEALGRPELDLTAPDSHTALSAAIRPDDTVVMLATLTPDQGRDYLTVMRNLRMAESVGRALQAGRCRHFVYLSSDAVYDAHQTPLDEDSTREPVDLYALTHTAREMMLGSVCEREKIPFCVLRPTNIYGPGDTHNNYGPNRFVRSALREGRIVLFGQGEERRSQVYVDDAVQLITLVLRHRSTGTLNLANRPAVSFRDVAAAVIALCPGPVRLEHAARSVPVVHRPYKPTQIARFIYNLGRPIGQIVHRPYVNSAVFAAFPGFTFTPLADGLRRYVAAEAAAKP